MTEADQTTLLLDRWCRGDAQARNELVSRDLEWIRRHVHRNLGDDLRRHCETGDLVQETMLRILDYVPRFPVQNRAQWLGLIGQIALNVIRCQHRGHHALKHDRQRQQTLSSFSQVWNDQRRSAVKSPAAELAAAEELDLMKLGMLLLKPEDQRILGLHLDGLSDAAIGSQLGRSANAVRTRRARALQKLFELAEEIRSGRIGQRFAAEDPS